MTGVATRLPFLDSLGIWPRTRSRLDRVLELEEVAANNFPGDLLLKSQVYFNELALGQRPRSILPNPHHAFAPGFLAPFPTLPYLPNYLILPESCLKLVVVSVSKSDRPHLVWAAKGSKAQ